VALPQTDSHKQKLCTLLAANFSRVTFLIHDHAIFRTWHSEYSKSTVVTLELHLRDGFAQVVRSMVIVRGKYSISSVKYGIIRFLITTVVYKHTNTFFLFHVNTFVIQDILELEEIDSGKASLPGQFLNLHEFFLCVWDYKN